MIRVQIDDWWVLFFWSSAQNKECPKLLKPKSTNRGHPEECSNSNWYASPEWKFQRVESKSQFQQLYELRGAVFKPGPGIFGSSRAKVQIKLVVDKLDQYHPTFCQRIRSSFRRWRLEASHRHCPSSFECTFEGLSWRPGTTQLAHGYLPKSARIEFIGTTSPDHEQCPNEQQENANATDTKPTIWQHARLPEPDLGPKFLRAEPNNYGHKANECNSEAKPAPSPPITSTSTAFAPTAETAGRAARLTIDAKHCKCQTEPAYIGIFDTGRQFDYFAITIIK